MAAYKEDEDVVTSKSGRKRKKSAKLLEMEEAAEMEKLEKSHLSKKVIDTVKGLRAALAPMTSPGQKNKKANPADIIADAPVLSPTVSPGSVPTKSSKKAKKSPSVVDDAPAATTAAAAGTLSPKLKITVKRPKSSDLGTQFEVVPSEADINSTLPQSLDVPPVEEKRKKKKKKHSSSSDGISPELFGELPSQPPGGDGSLIECNKGKKKVKKTKKIKVPLNMDSLDDLGVLDDDHEAFDDVDGEKTSGESLLPMYANTSEMAMKVKTSAERKASKVRKYKRKDDPLKARKRRTPTAYMLWCSSYRQKVITENPGIDFIQMSKRLGELWQALPEKQKMIWKRKAKKSAATGSTLISTGKGGASGSVRRGATLLQSGQQAAKRAVHQANISTASTRLTNGTDHTDNSFRVDCQPIDAAAHLTLLGESLELIGTRLKEHVGPCAVQGSVSVLLDSMICALAPLMCLTNEVPELAADNSRTFMNTLDNIAYIMPGIG